jgi:argininosuccinate lyase
MKTKKAELGKNDMSDLSNDNTIIIDKGIETFSKPVWGENNNINPIISEFLTTIDDDYKLYPHIIDSLKAQFKMHIKRNIIPEYEGKQLVDALDKVQKELVGDELNPKSAASIYDLIASRISDIAPEAYRWYSVARAQSCQTVGDLKIWVRNAIDILDVSFQRLQSRLIDRAEDTVKTIFPATSNSMLYQPTSLGHHLLAYVEMFGRDRSRLKGARIRLNESPFASGELVGSSFNVNREMVARLLSFDRAMQNSVDAVSSRDFIIEFLSIISNSFVNISRLADEMISWHSSSNNYISFDSTVVEQSSILPYKRDQLALEAIRSKATKSFGALMSVLSMCKGLSLENSRDYEEMIEPVFNSFRDLSGSIGSLELIVGNFAVNRKVMKEAASKDFSTAQDLVDWIVQKSKVNLVEAQSRARNIIDYAIEKGKKLSLLEISEIQQFEPSADDDIYSVLIPSRAIIARRSGNGSNPVQIRKSIRAAKRKYL